MRPGIVAIGLVVVALGAMCTFAPVFSPPGGSQFGAAKIQSRSVMVDSRYDFSWSKGGATDYVAAFDCGTTTPANLSSGSTAGAVCPSERWLAHGAGSSGELSIGAPPGDWVMVVAFQNASGTIDTGAQISVTVTEGLIGVPLLVLGAIVAVVGAFVRSRHPRTLPEERPVRHGERVTDGEEIRVLPKRPPGPSTTRKKPGGP